MYKKFLGFLTGIIMTCSLSAQNVLTGKVQEVDSDGHLKPLIGAFLNWEGTSVGVATDVNGFYKIEKVSGKNRLIVQYLGIKTDTLDIDSRKTEYNIILSTAQTLETVSIYANEGTYISIKPILTSVITSEGLRKAACCNLAESFENTATVDVEYSDAISGAKQIQMLGLAGIYSQILLENTPFIRLLSQQFGLGFVPGAWMESISISKGTASVTNGYESISGQIDVEYKKPETNTEKLFLNLYGNHTGRGELNLNTRFDVTENTSSMFLVHGSGQFAKMDMNKDGFLDMPVNYQGNIMNRWDYDVPDKFEGRTFLSYMKDYRQGGQTNFNPKTDKLTTRAYGLGVNTDKVDVISKNGFLLPEEEQSIGTILSFTFHNVNSYYGLKIYDAKQLSGYANILYSGRIKCCNPKHKISTGISFQTDFMTEKLNDTTMITNEFVPGAFAQYSFILPEKLTMILGMRLDYNTLYGLFWTPRLHLKYTPIEQTNLRFSIGKGYKSPHVLAENTSLLVSNRTFVFSERLKAEEAWNTGISLMQGFNFKHGQKSSFTIDYFYTHFINQAIVDVDQNPNFVYFYNLKGASYSHSVQAELLLNPIHGLEILTAYRFNYVKVSYQEEMRFKPFVVPHKALLNIGYSTRRQGWKFDATLQYNSPQRIPSTGDNPPAYQMPEKSPGYFILNAQITKKIKKFEIYLGGENLTNYKQKNPIIAADNPFSSYFDASMIYAPITGITVYAGMRFTLK